MTRTYDTLSMLAELSKNPKKVFKCSGDDMIIFIQCGCLTGKYEGSGGFTRLNLSLDRVWEEKVEEVSFQEAVKHWEDGGSFEFVQDGDLLYQPHDFKLGCFRGSCTPIGFLPETISDGKFILR